MLTIKKSVLCLAIGSVMTTAPVAVAAEEDNSEVERIEVTGSRIFREGAIAPSPVTVITAETLLSTGATNIGDALNELPALATTFSLASSGGSSIGTAGLNLLDLRGMGTARTLVLVNGKRHVGGFAGVASVDVNTIPTEWVESVEIVTGGASAVYGADAVTGVVNFRLKEDIVGLNVNGQYGMADDSDFENYRVALSYGADFADGRGNAAISIEYAEQNELNALDRDQTAISRRHLTNPDDAATVRTWYDNAGIWAINNAGVVGFYGGVPGFYSFNPDGTPVPQGTGTITDGISCAGENCDFVNLNEWVSLQPEFDRTTVNFKTNYDVTDNLNAYFEAKWSQTNSLNNFQPAFFFFDPENTLITRDNAYITPELGELMDQTGAGYVVVNRFMNDLGPRLEDNKREMQRYVLGLQGIVMDDWDLDAYAIYGETKQTRKNLNNLIFSKFRQSIDAVFDDAGNIVCRDAEAQAAGCVPSSLFGEGGVSPEAAAWFSTTTVADSKVSQYVAGASLANAALFELPAGAVGVATGIEYRKEKSESNEDPFAATGDTFFNALQPESGSFDVSEIYGEISVPLLADIPLIDSLVVDGAVRYADYETVGGVTSWKVGLDWTVYQDLRVRSTVSTALRAPNIGEFYGAKSQNFFNVDDSCKSSELAALEPETRAIRAANCAALGIPADFDSDYDSASIEGVSGGNDELKEEKSDSFTVGFAYQPSYVEGMSLTVDYWQIEIEDAIASVGAQDIIDRCVDSTTGIDNQWCALITRDADNYEITNLEQIVQNVAKQEASGVDIELAYDFALFSGDMRTNLIATYLIDRDEFPFQDEPDQKEEYAGTIGEANWQAQLNLAYDINNWNINWKTRYIEEVDVYTPQFAGQFDKPYSDIMTWGTYFVSDALVQYSFANGLSVGVGIDNLFDRDLPRTTSGTGTGSASYDNIGRFYYLTARFEM
ncbi:TonB-dependent receptor [Ferrimonas balearica DSM 9799]|uniref:TonB-dependent receptor n=1 Tax=Ferrimonas balearica (strain DSM 9799 / CCM 4581 / KCTC 23876 / PAT) TaxID=550540 RepID=E1SW74_FERBD|nr:TonB-dependent receptor [Ferrimonas balearica DSM 9799]